MLTHRRRRLLTADTRRRISFRKAWIERLEDRRLLTTLALLHPQVYDVPEDSQNVASSVATADFDADGILDYIGVTSESSRSWIRWGTGDGAFSNRAELSLRGRFAAPLDVDRDQDVDVVVATPAGFSLLINRGVEAAQWLGFDSPRAYQQTPVLSLAAGDFDQDGSFDLALGTANGVLVRLNDGKGDFGPAVSYLSGGGPKGLVAADFNIDGLGDLLVSDANTGAISLLQGAGDGTFEPTAISAAVPRHGNQFSPWAMHAADLNQDHELDLIIVQAQAEDTNVYVFFGDGAGDFSSDPWRYQIVGRPTSIASTDFDGDSIIDLVVGHLGFLHLPEYGNGQGGLSILLGRSAGGFSPAIRLAPGEVTSMAVEDLDDNGSPDLLAATSDGVMVLRQSSQAWLDAQPVHHSAGRDPRSVAVDDWNQDGYADMAIANFGANDLSLYWGNDEGGFSEAQAFAAAESPSVVLAGNFFATGQPAIAAVSAVAREVRLMLPSPDGTTRRQTSFDVRGALADAVAADVNGDGFSDIVTLQTNDGGLDVWQNQGNGDFELSATLPLSDGWSVVAGDVNRDGAADLITASLFEGVFVFLGTGAGSFGQATRYLHDTAEELDVTELTLADVDADGDLDVLAVVQASERRPSDSLTVMLNRGDGTFDEPQQWQTLPRGTVGLAPVDWNGDRWIDVIVATTGMETLVPRSAPGGSVSLLLGRGDGTFAEAVAHYLDDNDFSAVVTADVDRNLLDDLILVNPEGAQVVRNNSRWPGDATGDGRFDAADIRQIVNAGKYRTDEPASFAEGDWNRDGFFDQRDIMMALRSGRFSSTQLAQFGDFQRDGTLTAAAAQATPPPAIVIHEIMYHPASQREAEEFIELRNTGTTTVDLTGWQFTRGITFTFPQIVLEPDSYLAVAADLQAFSAQYPDVPNVIGSWVGKLSDREERIELADAAGQVVDQVHYADQGEWSVRVRGELDAGHAGWAWKTPHDGGGSSIELVNAGLPNEHGQNWSSSQTVGGTPGRANSVVQQDSAPLVLDVQHAPILPRPQDSVSITARLIDESVESVDVSVWYRVDGTADFQHITMNGQGTAGDRIAHDGIYTATIPPLPAGTIVEFVVQARDRGGRTRVWPGVDGGAEAGANALYQVLELPDWQDWDPARQPVTLLVMTAAERDELADIGDGPAEEAASNAQMNATWIRVDGTGVALRYSVGVRNRGGASRVGPPNNFRINFPRDRLWNEVASINLNSQFVHSQILGSAIYRLAGIPAAQAAPVRLLVNGSDLAESAGPRMFGSYAQLEVIDGQFPNRNLASDGQGNLYRAIAVGPQSGDLGYRGPDPDAYRTTYIKETNEEADDWTDLIRLTNVLNDAPDDSFLAELQSVIDVQQWMRFIALDALLGNRETGLSFGAGDNYWLYRGQQAPRFVLIPHDLDTLLGRARLAQPNASIFSYTATRGLGRLLTHPDTIGLYYQAFLDLIETVYNPQTLDPLFVQLLGGFVPREEIQQLQQFVRDRIAGVLAQIPRSLTVTIDLPRIGNLWRTALPVVSLTGTADAIRTRSVTVNGQEALWSPTSREWSLETEGEAGTQSLILAGSEWKYLDDGSNQGMTWHEPGFDDFLWKQGLAQFGYGDGDEVTRVSFGDNPNNKHVTTYFRQSFTVENFSEISGLTLHLLRDDGAIVYVNGQEAFRGNMPSGTVDFQTLASAWIGGAAENQFTSVSLPRELLHEGQNLIAVEVHQNSPLDFDLSFDLSLEAIMGQARGGLRLHPGINRVIVRAHDQAHGQGNVAQEEMVDVWYDGGLPVRDESVWDPPPNAPYVVPGGVLTADLVFAPQGPAYRIAGTIVVPEGVQVIVHPGTTIFFEENAGIEFRGGLLTAIGDEFNAIRLTRVPETTGSWSGLQFIDSPGDNRISHAILEHAVTSDGMVGLVNSRLTVDQSAFGHADLFRIRSVNSSLVVRDSVFTDIFAAGQPPTTDNASEHIWGSGILEGGEFLLERNIFGTTKGHNDAIDFDTARLPGPIPIIRDNIFAGGGDDALDLESDALIEGNLFRNYHKDEYNTATGDGNAISAGAAGHYTVVRNVFRDVDHAVQVKEDSFLVFANNTVSDARSAIYFENIDRLPGRGALVTNSIFHQTEIAFDAIRPTTDLAVHYSIVPESDARWGANNLHDDPRLDETPGSDLRPLPGSPAWGSGSDGRNRGAFVPAGVSLVGIPDVVTSSSSATVAVGGPGIVRYRYRLNDGPWSADLDVAAPVELNGLTDGSYVLTAIGQNIAGQWQNEQQATASHVWTVNTMQPRIRINELLAINDSGAAYHGTFPDLIELFHDGVEPFDLSGISLTDDPQNPLRFVFPPGTMIAPGGYLVIAADSRFSVPGLHTGFALNGDGERLMLFDRPERGGGLLDSVVFGPQIPNLSVGRSGPLEDWTLTRPSFGETNVAERLGDPTRVRINEWLAKGEVRFKNDFIELFNFDTLPVDVGGLFLTDDPIGRPHRHAIPPLAFVSGGGHVRFLADGDPQQGPEHLTFRLSPQQGQIALFGLQAWPIDQVMYFSQTTDTSMGRTPDGANKIAVLALPTPAERNAVRSMEARDIIRSDDEWSYDDSGIDRGTLWREVEFDDSQWKTGPGALAFETDPLPVPVGTELQHGATTYYFRRSFTLDEDPRKTSLSFLLFVDDGAAVYINGTEVVRVGLPEGTIDASTRASRGVGNAAPEGPFPVPPQILVPGENRIAVEVHQISPTNNDVTFGLTMSAEIDGLDESVSRALDLLNGLRISEIMFQPAGGSDYEFLEFVNVGDQVLELQDVRLDGAVQFTFPQWSLHPQERVIVAGDVQKFRSRYGGLPNVLGPFEGNLSNEGEEIELLLPAPSDAAIVRIEYGPTWAGGAGEGYSLEPAIPLTASVARWNEIEAWRLGRVLHGSPGAGTLRGDFDGDLAVTAADVDLLWAHIAAKEAWRLFDLTDDGIVDGRDVDALISGPLETFYGDADLDGDVDFADFVTFAGQFGNRGRGWSQGDFNGDAEIGFADFVIMASNFGQSRSRLLNGD